LTEQSRAASTLAIVIAIGVAAVMLPAPPPVAATADPSSRAGDLAAFTAVASRLHAGEPYYEAMGDELRARGYPTAQVFNWRTPLLLEAVAIAPFVCRVMLILSGVLLAIATVTVAESAAAMLAGAMQLGTVILIAVPAAIYLGEVPAGVLIGISVCAYARGMWAVGAGLAVTALFLRELAGPYCLICAALAVVQKRRAETWTWLVAAAGYAAFFAWHASSVRAHQLASDLAHRDSWLQFGGLRFLLDVIGMQSWLIFLPRATAALALMLIVAGVLRPLAPMHLRAAAAVYAALFLFVGQSFNTYWGFVAGPMWALACGYGLAEIIRSGRVLLAAPVRPGGH
jgi:hypothetical protein